MADDRKSKRNRSPLYPSTDLEIAVRRAGVLYEREVFNHIPWNVAIEHWDLSPKGSTGMRALAALKHFGLIEEEGSKDDRKVWLSALAKEIVTDPQQTREETRVAIQQAALAPEIYKTLWSHYGANMPSDATLAAFLKRDMGFNPRAVDDLIRDFRRTISFADLDADYLLDDAGDGDATDGDNPPDTGEKTPPKTTATPPAGAGDKGKMPDVKKANAEPLDIPIRLKSGAHATLRIPVPMSKADFNYLKKFLETNLELQEDALTAGGDGNGEG